MAGTGAAVLCCDEHDGMRRHLTGSPKEAVHLALSQPHRYLGGAPEMGSSAQMEDACVAYQLFQVGVSYYVCTT